MKKIITLSVMLAAPCLQPAIAQTQNYYGADGSYQGQSVQMGNTRNYYGADGSYQGQGVDMGGGTRNYYGSTGGYLGQSQRNGYQFR
ncbi:MAG: hypothetical protein RLZZ104_1534 [Pseudomonadota bacterium]|jgi:hypothetical protein